MIHRLIAVIVVCFISVGCVTTGSTTMAATAAKNGILTVKVTSGGVALSNATVTVAGISKVTSSIGLASFSLPLRQTYTVNVTALWYVPWSTTVWFQKSQTVTAALQSEIVIPQAVLIVPSTPVNK